MARRSTTISVYMPDVWEALNLPGIDADPEIEITVSYDVEGADPSVGIMSAYTTDVTVENSDDTALLPVDLAQRWLDSGHKSAQRANDEINEAANEEDDYYD